MHRDVGHVRAKLDQRDAELALLFVEAGERSGDRRGHDRFHPEVRRTDHRVDVPQRRRVGRDHVDVDAQAIGEQADRLLDALSAVDRVQRRVRVEHDLAIAVDRILARAQQLIDVGLLDRMAAKLDLDIGEIADEAARAVARPHVLDGHSRHAFGELDRFAHCELARRHVGDVAALDAAALALAGAEHGQPSVRVGPRDHRADLRRADVEDGDQLLFGGRGHLLLLIPAAVAALG